MPTTTVLEPAQSYLDHRPAGEPRTDFFYDMMEIILRESNVFDYTDGYYETPDMSYEAAQLAQAHLLLQRAQCVTGSRVLDIGCGAGRLLSVAQEMGADATGITVSHRQANYCRSRGLHVEVRDYRDIPASWNGQFDAVIANGSIEHFVSPPDVIAGRDDEIYGHLFATVHRLLRPRSSSRRFVTTVMHFNRVHPDPHDILRGPFAYKWGSDKFHAAYVQRVLGGWCATRGQFERCSQGSFDLVDEMDGTDDYRRTSEEWLHRVRRTMLRSWRGFAVAARLSPYLLRCPRHLALTLGLMVTESWCWQFRGDNPPASLLRHTWQAV